jgi:hypothetical protein
VGGGGQEVYSRVPSSFCPLKGTIYALSRVDSGSTRFYGRVRGEEKRRGRGERAGPQGGVTTFVASMRESLSSRRHRGLRLAADRGKVYSKPVTRITAVDWWGDETFRNLSIEILQVDWKLTCECPRPRGDVRIVGTLNFIDGTHPYWWS